MDPAYADECKQLLPETSNTHKICQYPIDDYVLVPSPIAHRPLSLSTEDGIRRRVSNWYFYTDSGAYLAGVVMTLGLILVACLIFYGLDWVFRWGYVDLIWEAVFPAPTQPNLCPLPEPDRHLCGILGYDE